jgi:hypothetical protein
MTVKTISTEAAAVTSPALSMASPPELSSASSSVSGGESPVFSTHQSMKQMAEGENYQKTISFAEINKREQNFSKKRDFGNILARQIIFANIQLMNLYI